ncbi:uncharacterized protein LOC134267461 [Saccostrea cucullata]|uniref:uncharacterized protein LOC134267461 n=1 Tax=Saccostrea cuccullata TaxID=36930 RepID=UPI002ED5D930
MADAKVQSLEKELADMKMKLAHVIAKESYEPKVVFTPRERKINKFSGKRDGLQTIDEFIEDIELTLKTRPTSDSEKVNFIISHLEGPARVEVRYRSNSEKKKPKDILDILREVFGDRGTISELLSDFYQCKQGDETLQEYCHRLMCKLDRICKKDNKTITDRDLTLRNQFAENVKPVWLRRELKKRIRSTPAISFSDIREEATLLMEDSQDSTPTASTTSYEYEVPVLAAQSQPKSNETSDVSKLLLDLKTEMKSMREKMESLKMQKKSQNSDGMRCFYCGKLGHLKKDCRKRKRDAEAQGKTQNHHTSDLNGPGLRLRADL